MSFAMECGSVFGASQFPKHRETRAPYVDELLPHKTEIDPKYAFIFRLLRSMMPVIELKLGSVGRRKNST